MSTQTNTSAPLQAFLKAITQGYKTVHLNGSRANGLYAYDLYVDEIGDDGLPVSGIIYRFKEYPKGYRLETIKRQDWNKSRKGFETLQTLSLETVENKRGLKAFKQAIEKLRKAYLYVNFPGCIVGSFDSIYYQPFRHFTQPVRV